MGTSKYPRLLYCTGVPCVLCGRNDCWVNEHGKLVCYNPACMYARAQAKSAAMKDRTRERMAA